MTYPWGDDRRFNSYAGYFRRLFGGRVQKLSVDAGFTCPNRDGTLGRGGCTFCDNGAFTPSYCRSAKSITQQIDEGIAFHARRYRSAGRYLVYFQSYSNTYAPLERLRALYGEALAHPQVAQPAALRGVRWQVDLHAVVEQGRAGAVVGDAVDGGLHTVNRSASQCPGAVWAEPEPGGLREGPGVVDVDPQSW